MSARLAPATGRAPRRCRRGAGRGDASRCRAQPVRPAPRENGDGFVVPECLEVGDERVERRWAGDRDRQGRDEDLGVGQLLDVPGGPLGVHAAGGDRLRHLGERRRGASRIERPLQVLGVGDLEEVVAALEPVEA